MRGGFGDRGGRGGGFGGGRGGGGFRGGRGGGFGGGGYGGFQQGPPDEVFGMLNVRVPCRHVMTRLTYLSGQ